MLKVEMAERGQEKSDYMHVGRLFWRAAYAHRDLPTSFLNAALK